jgi:tRNA dimethylallyltransferase
MPLIIFIVGPTGVGKSEIAAALAKRINGEIVSCDSMQVYKGMDIVTSKPSAAIRKKTKHHLIGIVSPFREYDVSRFRKGALKAVQGIIKRRKVPLLVGGTGLYMSILINGIFELKVEDRAIRERLYKEAAARGSSYLYKRLQKVDPAAADKIHPHDAKRIIRALEVFIGTGKPISHWQKQRRGLGAEHDVRIFCLNRKKGKLYKRIDERVEKMFKAGLEKEAKDLLKSKLSRTAAYAIGLKELKGYFDGAYDLEEAKRQMKLNTRRYAKRQLTWFRKDKRIKWLDVGDKEKPSAVASRILINITSNK